MTAPSLSAGTVVHVRVHDVDGPACRPGWVLVAGRAGYPSRIRVAIPTPIGQPIGQQDAEGWYQGRAMTFANPDGTTREGDSWHYGEDCPHGE